MPHLAERIKVESEALRICARPTGRPTRDRGEPRQESLPSLPVGSVFDRFENSLDEKYAQPADADCLISLERHLLVVKYQYLMPLFPLFPLFLSHPVRSGDKRTAERREPATR